jgi:hypothetical protein
MSIFLVWIRSTKKVRIPPDEQHCLWNRPVQQNRNEGHEEVYECRAHTSIQDLVSQGCQPWCYGTGTIVALTQNVGSCYCGQSLDLSGTKEVPSRIPVTRRVGVGWGGGGGREEEKRQ